jgi:hypothetical protein
LSRSECQTGEWYSIGERDGANGYTEDRFLENAKACSKHGISSDRERWLDGRARGLERYCTARNAFSVGAQNASYQGVCAGPAEGEFMHGYNLGHSLAEARGRRDHWEEEIRRIHRRFDEGKAPDHDDKSDSKGDGKKSDHTVLSDAERVELGFRLGVAVTRREEARRDCDELEQRGRQL